MTVFEPVCSCREGFSGCVVHPSLSERDQRARDMRPEGGLDRDGTDVAGVNESRLTEPAPESHARSESDVAATAHLIAAGGAFTDEDAIQVAQAFLEQVRR